MRIAFISCEYPPDSSHGGIATYVAQAARMMTHRGHEVEVFVSSPCRKGRFERDGIVEHCVPEIDRRQFGVVVGRTFANRHAERPFDVVEGPDYNADARVAIELVPQVPLVVKMHTPSLTIAKLNCQPGSAFSNSKHFFRNIRGIIASACRRKPVPPFLFAPRHILACWQWDLVEAAHTRNADIVAPPCLELCQYARDVWKVQADNIRLAPHPYVPEKSFLTLNPETTGFTSGLSASLKNAKESKSWPLPFLLCYKPCRKQSFAFLELQPGIHVQGCLTMIGFRQRLPQYKKQLEFLGKYPLDRMAEAYGSVDVCIFPSLWENFPNVCLEAMSAGRAIVASNVGGMPEMLDQGRVGRVANPGNPGSLAREIIALLKSPSERKRLGELARERVLKAYNADIIGEMMEGIYREAMIRKAAKYQKIYCRTC